VRPSSLSKKMPVSTNSYLSKINTYALCIFVLKEISFPPYLKTVYSPGFISPPKASSGRSFLSYVEILESLNSYQSPVAESFVLS